MGELSSSCSIDSLRDSIEQDQRFKTVINGYDKKSVNAYLQKLADSFRLTVSSLEREKRVLMTKNAGLQEKIEEQERVIAEFGSDDRKKLEAEYNMQSKLILSLKENERKLIEDIRERDRTIQELEEKLERCRQQESERMEKIDSLNSDLKESLRHKFEECSGLIGIWQKELEEISGAAGEDPRAEILHFINEFKGEAVYK